MYDIFYEDPFHNYRNDETVNDVLHNETKHRHSENYYGTRLRQNTGHTNHVSNEYDIPPMISPRATSHGIEYNSDDMEWSTEYSASPSLPISDHVRYNRHPPRPLTKQVDQMIYELPRAHQYAHMSLRSYISPIKRHTNVATNRGNGGIVPQFLKVFGDVPDAPLGSQVILDCVLLGIPRPRVAWLFNGIRIAFSDVQIDDTADLCRLTIPSLMSYHYGTYMVVAENEVGRALTKAVVSPPLRIISAKSPY